MSFTINEMALKENAPLVPTSVLSVLNQCRYYMPDFPMFIYLALNSFHANLFLLHYMYIYIRCRLSTRLVFPSDVL